MENGDFRQNNKPCPICILLYSSVLLLGKIHPRSPKNEGYLHTELLPAAAFVAPL